MNWLWVLEFRQRDGRFRRIESAQEVEVVRNRATGVTSYLKPTGEMLMGIETCEVLANRQPGDWLWWKFRKVEN